MLEIFVHVVKETEGAFLVSDGEVEVWIPRSLVRNADEVVEGEDMEIVIPLWKAEELELL